jgi:putative transposase
VAGLCRTHGITEQTYYRWKAKYGGTELSEMQRLKQLEDENRRLRHIVAEQTLDIQALRAVVGKKVVGSAAKRVAVADAVRCREDSRLNCSPPLPHLIAQGLDHLGLSLVPFGRQGGVRPRGLAPVGPQRPEHRPVDRPISALTDTEE